MKVITVSRFFPAYHPKVAQPTYFVEKIMRSPAFQQTNPYRSFTARLEDLNGERLIDTHGLDAFYELMDNFEMNLLWPGSEMKHHTIRAGKRFKTGEMASLRVWSGKPYHSPQIEFAQVRVKCFDFELKFDESCIINGGARPIFCVNGQEYPYGCNFSLEIATNDGLELLDMKWWFQKPFTGQIICWNESISY